MTAYPATLLFLADDSKWTDSVASGPTEGLPASIQLEMPTEKPGLQEQVQKHYNILERSRKQIQRSHELSASAKRRARESRALMEWLRESVLPESRPDRRGKG